MKINESVLKSEEKAVLSLRSIYDSFGYTRYQMSKFEEYELYVRNKDFLISDAVITFTDTNGKLLALKPDVTLSIIKDSNLKPGQLQKLYYHENVYRVSQNTGAFKEITQVGLECIGAIDEYCLYEVLMLAAKSLKSISESCVLDISHMGIISAVMDALDLSSSQCAKVLAFISQKNAHELSTLLDEFQVPEKEKEILLHLVTLYGNAQTVLPQLEELLKDSVAYGAFCELKRVVNTFEQSEFKEMLHIDFSVINDLKYYNGIIFKGFVEGIPASVLSGGQYDKLMQKMKRNGGAVGFAVYLDMLERFEKESRRYDVDTLILYREGTAAQIIRQVTERFLMQGTVLAQKQQPKHLRYQRLVEICGNEVKIIEENA